MPYGNITSTLNYSTSYNDLIFDALEVSFVPTLREECYLLEMTLMLLHLRVELLTQACVTVTSSGLSRQMSRTHV